MPSDAPEVKLAATRGYGAEVVLYERERSHREEIAAGIAAERGATVVPPFDDPRIVAGAGTAALELLEEAGSLDAIVVPVGGGGLMSGTAIAAHGIDSKIAIYGVEPETGDDFAQSLARGERVKIAVPKTIADGLQTTSPSELTFGIAREHDCTVVTVSDEELSEAVAFAFERMKLVVEPSGAAGDRRTDARSHPERRRQTRRHHHQRRQRRPREIRFDTERREYGIVRMTTLVAVCVEFLCEFEVDCVDGI